MGVLSIALTALAQQDTNAPVKMKPTLVTGSLIPTAETVGPAPVEVVSTADLKETGVGDVLSALQKISTAFAGNGNLGQTLNNGGHGEANVALRNLPTLVLLDGRRLANSALSNGQAVDLNTLPLSMIDRIEVLKDGASTIYGSDAIGGVINIITKKNYSGAEVDAHYGFASDSGGNYYDERFSVVAGVANEHTSITVGADYYHSNPLLSKDRDVSSQSIAASLAQGFIPPSYISPSYPGRVGSYILAGSPLAVGAPGYNAAITAPLSPGNPTMGGLTYVPGTYTSVAAYIAANPGVYIPLSTTPGGAALNAAEVANYPLLNTTDLGTLSIQEQTRRQAFANFDHEIFDKNLELYGQFLYANTESDAQLAPSPVSSLSLYKIAVPANNPYNPFGIPLGSSDSINLGVRSRFLDFGNRLFDSSTEFFHFVAGLKGQITDNYSWDAAYNYNRSDQTEYTRNAVNGAALNLALQPLLVGGVQQYNAQGKPLSMLTDFVGNNLPAYNIFAVQGQNDPNTINAIRTTLYESGVSELHSWDFTFRGTPFDLPAGKAAFALGGEYVDEVLTISYDGLSQQGLVPGLNAAYSVPKVSRERYAGFAEISLPITSPDMNIPVLHALEINASGRYEHLSPGGNSSVPKVGFRWQPIDDEVTIRGTYSQGFIAPSLYTLYGPPAQSNPTLGALGQETVNYISNPNLAPATSENYTLGIVYSPKQIKNLTLSAEYYRVKEDGIPYTPDPNVMVDSLQALGSASPYASDFTFQNGTHLTAATPNQITALNWGNMNIPTLPGAAQRTDGIDFGASYVIETDSVGKFTLAVNANLLLSYDVQAGPGAPWLNYKGQYTDAQVVSPSNGTLPDYTIVPSLTWEYKNLTYFIRARYIPSVVDQGDGFGLPASEFYNDYTLSGKAYTVPSYYTIDMQLAYNFKQSGAHKWYDGTTLAVGCNNVTDNIAPRIPSSSEDNTDKSTYDILGRFFYFEIAKKF